MLAANSKEKLWSEKQTVQTHTTEKFVSIKIILMYMCVSSFKCEKHLVSEN